MVVEVRVAEREGVVAAPVGKKILLRSLGQFGRAIQSSYLCSASFSAHLQPACGAAPHDLLSIPNQGEF